ncbi:MAG: sensor histidine kinase, partial [Pseudooceanicola nanhaiensis]
DVLDHSVRAALQERGIEIRRDPQAEALVVETDVDRLSQVFINLIANAQKYCDAAQPVLTIAVSRHRGAIHVDFSDNGSGVETGMQGLIFEKFSRIGHHQAGGAGLGLAICREVMARLGGSIAYLPGQGGAAFRVTLPGERALAAQ